MMSAVGALAKLILVVFLFELNRCTLTFCFDFLAVYRKMFAVHVSWGRKKCRPPNMSRTVNAWENIDPKTNSFNNTVKSVTKSVKQ